MSILHRVDSFTALRPLYVSRFRCLGADCDENCCNGWDITVDQKTFEGYVKNFPLALMPRFKQSVERRMVAPSRENYASIKNNPQTGECPFLEERLCAIHRDMGEDKLPNTCFNYPRYTRNILGQLEQTLTLSCPEAARLALLEADAFDFVEEKVLLRANSINVINEKWGISLQQMNDIRIFCFQLIRTEGLELWAKLAVLGGFCSQLDDVLKDKSTQTVSTLIDSFLSNVESGKAFEDLAEIQPDYNFQAQLFSTVWSTRKNQPRSASRQRVQDMVASGLGLDQNAGMVDRELLLENYRSGLNNIPITLTEMPYLLDHYVLNEMFRDFFPFGAESVYENYVGIVFRFGILRFMISAISVNSNSLPDRDLLIKTVWVCCRIYQYASLTDLFNLALKEVGWNKIDNIYGLLPG